MKERSHESRKRDLAASPYLSEFSALTQTVFCGTNLMCGVQPDFLSVLHTFLKHHSGFLMVLLKGIFVETHKLRC